MVDSQTTYRVKKIQFLGSHRCILLQNQNGPCPLLGLANVLLLRNQLSLPPHTRYVCLSDLRTLITDVLLDLDKERTTAKDEFKRTAWRDNFDGSLKTLKTLHEGMDVNVQFKNVEAFEFTENLAIFDLLNIRLLHGWVVSDQDVVMHNLIARESYNTIVERVFTLQDNSSEADRQQAALITSWMEESCSQMTHDGLDQLHSVVRERELAILFRNSHFSTLFKKNGHLFLLNTDIGFLDCDLIWEKLDNVDGDTMHVDHDFRQIESASRINSQQRMQINASNDIEISVSYDERPSALLHPNSARQLVSRESRVKKYCLPALGVIIIVIFLLFLVGHFQRI